MELRHIRYFLAVVDAGSLSRAAEAIGIGQPPLSLQIKALEEEIGARLFDRVPKGVELTFAGQAFWERVRRLPEQAEAAADAARRAARGELGALHVGFTASAAFNPAVAGAIRRFRRAYPDVDLHLRERNTLTLIEQLTHEELDIAFLRPTAADPSDFRYQQISEEPLIAALPALYSQAQQDALHLADLANRPLITFPREIGHAVFDIQIEVCRNAGFHPTLGQSAPQFTSIVHLVAAELGFSLVPASIAHARVDGVVYRPLADVSATVSLSLAWRRIDRSPFLQHFIDGALR